jgi:hypothetical protein
LFRSWQGPAESFYDGDQLEMHKVKALSRTYAQAVSGQPVEMFFDSETTQFQLIFIANTVNTSFSALLTF